MQLIRNHAEAVVWAKGVTDLSNMLGFNFRLTEIQAAIGIEQLKKLGTFVGERVAAAARLSKGLKDLKGIRTPVVKPNCTHVYYVYPLLYDEAETDVPRDLIIKALQAEGVPVSGSYANLHLLPMYQNKIAYGKKGFPWKTGFYKGNVSYQKGICPVAEKLQDGRYIGIGLCLYRYTCEETDLTIQAFRKVWSNLEQFNRNKRCATRTS
jgi:dTDP-4-amino-4,6-dideoxygalactose transaminase